MKVAVVGLGGMGSTHYNLYRKMDDAEIVALVDVREEKVKEKAAECSANFYTDIDEMLACEKPDFVDIATPSYLHAGHSLKVLSKGIPVICEKPAALKAEDIENIYRCASENNTIFMPAHVLRFWPEYQWLQNAVKEKTYGKLCRLDMWRYGEKPRKCWQNWILNSKKSGMVPFDLHIHDIDLMVAMLGKPEKVSSHEILDAETTNVINTVCQYPGNLEVCAKAAWYSNKLPFSMGFEAVFENAVAVFRDDVLTLYPNEGESEIIKPEKCTSNGLSEINVGNTQGYYNEIRYFMSCVANKTQAEKIAKQELLNTIEVISAATKIVP